MRAGGLGSVVAVGSDVKSLKAGDKVEGTLGEVMSSFLWAPSVF
jgi:NADPH:quinone reductase-like Zn-dependent oxidoreductase